MNMRVIEGLHVTEKENKVTIEITKTYEGATIADSYRMMEKYLSLVFSAINVERRNILMSRKIEEKRDVCNET